jgi:hypothetical protein
MGMDMVLDTRAREKERDGRERGCGVCLPWVICARGRLFSFARPASVLLLSTCDLCCLSLDSGTGGLSQPSGVVGCGVVWWSGGGALWLDLGLQSVMGEGDLSDRGVPQMRFPDPDIPSAD